KASAIRTSAYWRFVGRVQGRLGPDPDSFLSTDRMLHRQGRGTAVRYRQVQASVGGSVASRHNRRRGFGQGDGSSGGPLEGAAPVLSEPSLSADRVHGQDHRLFDVRSEQEQDRVTAAGQRR